MSLVKRITFASALIRNRNICKQCCILTRNAVRLGSSKSSESSGSDQDKTAQNKSTSKNNEALEKLNILLKQMINEDVSTTTASKIDLAKPKNKRRTPHKKPEDVQVKKQSPENEIEKAVKEVAAQLGDDTKKVESELLIKLLSTAPEGSSKTTNLSDIVKGMQIDRTSDSRAAQVRNMLERSQTSDRGAPSRFPRRQFERPIPYEKIDLFGGDRLGVFESTETYKDPGENKTWNNLYKRELKLAVTHPPSNYFQQMILWTEQGKIWKFPIDNEQGLEEEQGVCFSDHVFLEKHLQPWCPTRGPIRHFMELVCVGLSKNSYLTVKEKKGHIEWYKNYFETHKKVLEDVGVVS